MNLRLDTSLAGRIVTWLQFQRVQLIQRGRAQGHFGVGPQFSACPLPNLFFSWCDLSNQPLPLASLFFFPDSPVGGIRGLLADKLPDISVDQCGFFVSDPVSAVRNTLDRQIRNELVQTLKVARQQRFVFVTPDNERRHLHFQ